MSQNTHSVEVAQTKTTTNYGVYDSPDGDEKQAIVGTYISDGITEKLGENVTITLGSEDGVSATLDRVTSGYSVLSTEADAIESMYVAHATLDDMFDDYDSEEGVDSIGVSLSESDEDAFEEALEAVTVNEEATENEAEALISGSDGEDESEEEEIEISDEELSLVEN
jgi:hypothetical protein